MTKQAVGVIDSNEIVSGLAALGLTKRSVVVVHSSLRSFGRVEGGAAAVAKALVSCCGTVVVHSGTWDLTGLPEPPGLRRLDNGMERTTTWEEFDSSLENAVPFSSDLPVDKQMGAIPEALRTGFQHVRGQHPLRSFLAIGDHAEEIMSHEQFERPLAPIEAAADLGGEVLLLGVSHTSNTAIHVAEQRLGRSCFYRYAKTESGVWAELPNIPGAGDSFDDLEPALRNKTRETRIGSCRARLIAIQDVIDEAEQAIAQDSDALLCSDRTCRCELARRQRKRFLSTGSPHLEMRTAALPLPGTAKD